MTSVYFSNLVIGTPQLVGQHKNQQYGNIRIAKQIATSSKRTRVRVSSVQTVFRIRLEHFFRVKRFVCFQPFLSNFTGHVRRTVSVYVKSNGMITWMCCNVSLLLTDWTRFRNRLEWQTKRGDYYTPCIITFPDHFSKTSDWRLPCIYLTNWIPATSVQTSVLIIVYEIW